MTACTIALCCGGIFGFIVGLVEGYHLAVRYFEKLGFIVRCQNSECRTLLTVQERPQGSCDECIALEVREMFRGMTEELWRD